MNAVNAATCKFVCVSSRFLFELKFYDRRDNIQRLIITPQRRLEVTRDV